MKKDLSIEYLGVKCENPFFLSSSPVGGNYDMIAKCFETGWGGVFYKTVSIFVPDECSPRFTQTNKEGLPWIGFKNMEQNSEKPVEENFEHMVRLKRDYPDKVVVASIMGSSDEEWRTLAKMCDEAGVDLIEGNFSCPQMTQHGAGADVGVQPDVVGNYCKAVTSVTKIPFIAKTTPNITDMCVPGRAAIAGGAAGLSAINTIRSITNIDFETMSGMPVVDGKSSISGYSGAAVKPIALRFIAQMAQDEVLKNIPLSGIGGIETWKDALEFIAVGARNIQVTTAIMQYGYRIVEDMISGMSYFMAKNGIQTMDELVGCALPNLIPAENLNRSFKILPAFDTEKCLGCGRCYISCYDGGHQAIDWDAENRRPILNNKCVGCHLCLNVCPVQECITPGEVVWKEGRKPTNITMKKHYE